MYDEILLPVDEPLPPEALLQHVARLATWAEASVTVLHVADTSQDSVTLVEDQVIDVLVESGEETTASAAETLRALGATVETDVVQGNPAPTIVEYAERYEYDLVVMHTRADEGLAGRLLGSVAKKVLRLASVPVLTMRAKPDERLSFPYEELLVPTDGSDVATQAGRHAFSMASALDATIHLLSVVDDTGLRGTVADDEGPAQEAIDTLAALDTDPDPALRTHIEHGDPKATILDYAERVDAIVMGTTGRRGTERILLGSVAEATVRAAPIPVFTLGAESST
ncbi:MAG: universal stress protein [Halobacteriaceae archaeon]